MLETQRVAPSPAVLARGALRRLAQMHLEPTPENYARAYAEEAGQPAPVVDPRAQAGAWAALVERLARNLERRGVQWTAARRKESLRRLFESSRSDASRLLQRLQVLMTAWDDDVPADAADTGFDDPLVEPAAPSAANSAADAAAWMALLAVLESTVRAALPADEPRAAEL
ncbi:MAG: GGDEF domain-containing protein, partial [Rubrivivax sp.]|nr:GGDEF domain-containing protein [Rubrivivax sp.]